MENYNDYREIPRTGRTPGYSDHEHDPKPVDPSVLTDDRDNPDLLTFEKTWGHRVLAGLGVAMIVIAIILIAFCIVQLVRVADVAALMPEIGLVGMYLYGTALVCGIALVVPAIIAVYVAKHPSKVMIAIVMAIAALVLVVAFLGYALAVTPQYMVTALLYSLALAILPIVYLVAALKIKRSL